MAHLALHISIGIAVGTAIRLRPVLCAIASRTGMAAETARMMAVAFGMGLLAIAPSALHWLGAPLPAGQAWWTNFFVFYGLVEDLRHSGMIVGGLGLAAAFAFHYALLLFCLLRFRRE